MFPVALTSFSQKEICTQPLQKAQWGTLWRLPCPVFASVFQAGLRCLTEEPVLPEGAIVQHVECSNCFSIFLLGLSTAASACSVYSCSGSSKGLCVRYQKLCPQPAMQSMLACEAVTGRP